jgi:hypothetical protein
LGINHGNSVSSEESRFNVGANCDLHATSISHSYGLWKGGGICRHSLEGIQTSTTSKPGVCSDQSRFAKLAKTIDGIEVDIALGALPFEERTIARASVWEIAPDVVLTTCSAEDLIAHKAFAGRDLDWGDVERILIRQHGKLNLHQIHSELKPLLELKGESEALGKLEQKLATVERRLKARV